MPSLRTFRRLLAHGRRRSRGSWYSPAASAAPVLLVLLLSAGACRGRGGVDLRPDERLPLAGMDQAETLAVRGERVWIGAPGQVRAADPAGRFAWPPIATGSEALPVVVGNWGNLLFARAGKQLIVADASTGRVEAVRDGMGANHTVPDPLQRFLFVATPSGAVLGLNPRTLETAWAWPRLGRRTTAAAMSPEGDRFYMVVAAGNGNAGPVLLVRDAQTGRIMGSRALPFPLSRMETTRQGLLVGVGGEDGETDVLLVLRPAANGAEILWRRRAGSLAVEPPLRLYVDPTGRRLAVSGAGGEGMRVLNASTGRTIGTVHPAPRDAAFGNNGVLYALVAGELRVYR